MGIKNGIGVGCVRLHTHTDPIHFSSQESLWPRWFVPNDPESLTRYTDDHK